MRQTGRSTRLADYYIQKLFTKGGVRVMDHHNTSESDQYLLDRIIRRIKLEHPGLKYDVNGFKISLIHENDLGVFELENNSFTIIDPEVTNFEAPAPINKIQKAACWLFGISPRPMYQSEMTFAILEPGIPRFLGAFMKDQRGGIFQITSLKKGRYKALYSEPCSHPRVVRGGDIFVRISQAQPEL